MNLVNGIMLIVLGLAGYFLNESRPPTALIGPIIGLIFIVLTPQMKAENKNVAHIIAGLTIILPIILLFRMLKGGDIEMDRKFFLLGGMVLSCLITTVVYVMGFIAKRKERQNKTNS